MRICSELRRISWSRAMVFVRTRKYSKDATCDDCARATDFVLSCIALDKALGSG